MSLYSADAFLRFPPGYGIPIQKNTVLSGHLPNLHCWVTETARFVSQEVVVGDLLSALERIFCCPGPGQLKLLGEPGQPGFSSHDFLGSGTGTKIKRHRFNRSLVGGNMSDFPINFGKFWIFSIQNCYFLGLGVWNPLSFQVFFDVQLASLSILRIPKQKKSKAMVRVNHEDIVLLTTEHTQIMAQNYIAISAKPATFMDHI